MGIPVFLSYPRPATGDQRAFVGGLQRWLENRDFEPRTLGITDYDGPEPLTAIRRLLLESNGLITVAFRRMHLESGDLLLGREPPYREEDAKEQLTDIWLTTPWAHIEPAMAYQVGLPILLLREKGVRADGVLEQRVLGLYAPDLDLEEYGPTAYFRSKAWRAVAGKWEGYARCVVERRGRPPQLF